MAFKDKAKGNTHGPATRARLTERYAQGVWGADNVTMAALDSAGFNESRVVDRRNMWFFYSSEE